ncbi:MAG: hypothetical protein L6R35_002073 [Caloplaca aegaea]|nr:MAG: hypothetical protein L6R35_002073 [Caloplaca aegaea]
MMKAVRFHGKGDIRLDDIEVPTCGKGQVKVKPAYVGICGTDLHEYLGGANLIPTTPHPITKEKIPLTLGHEFSGVVEEVGDDVTDVKMGQRVSVQPIIYDGTCGACRDGLINCCDNNGFIGLSGWGGGLSEHVVVPRAAIYEIPDSVSMKLGALTEPLSVAWHSIDISPLKKGDKVLVLGGGPIGLGVIQCLKARGAETIIASEVSPRRKEFMKNFGAHHVLDPTQDDIVARVREICGGVGADVGFDAAGVQVGLNQALKAIRAQGTLVNIAVWEKPAQLQMNDIVFRERKYIGTTTFVAGDFRHVLDAMASGSLQPEPMITKVIKMDEVEEKGFKALIEEKDKHVKILVEVNP